MAYSRNIVIKKQTPKPTSQPFEVGCVSTIELILSVMVAKVSPGSMTGARVLADCDFGLLVHRLAALRLFFEFRVRVADLRQIGGARTSVQFAQQTVVARVRFSVLRPGCWDR